MSKFFQAFLTGIFFTFILDFFLFLGIKENYIDFYEIDLYYNILFADNQFWLLNGAVSLLLGFVIIYLNNNRVSAIVLGILLFLVSLTLVPSVGFTLGSKLFTQKDVRLHNDRHTFIGDIYYSGREKITFYDIELDKIIILEKKDLK